jgi:hypothetical protein
MFALKPPFGVSLSVIDIQKPALGTIGVSVAGKITGKVLSAVARFSIHRYQRSSNLPIPCKGFSWNPRSSDRTRNSAVVFAE